MTDHRTRVGVDSIDRIFLMENHDRAYHIWREAKVRQRILMHVDAHHDSWWMNANEEITIANFICPALKEDIVREVYWIVPDQSLETSASRRAVVKHLKRITKDYPGKPGPLQISDGRISTTLMGKTFTACSLNSLPALEECVLLDIDVDFLMIPRVSYDETDSKGPAPWCWPQDLVARLCERGIRSDLVTVAYSVEGGYTPLEWKYLGEEVARMLSQPAATDGMAQFELMRAASLARIAGDSASAEQQFRQAAEMAPAWAAPCYNLACLLTRQKKLPEARSFHKRALALDASYRTPYAGTGIANFRSGNYPEAETGFREALSLDPQNAYAHLGLARVARQRKQWALAEKELRAALSLEPDLMDAHRQLGYVLAKQGRNREAITSYERSLKLALAGHHPLDGYIVTNPGRNNIRDSGHRRTNARLAELYAREGDKLNAIACYRLALAGDSRGALLRFRLAWAYAKQRRLKAAAIESGRAFATAPSSIVDALRKS